MKKLFLIGVLALAGIGIVGTPSADAAWYRHRHHPAYVYVSPYAYPYYGYYSYPYSSYYYATPGYSSYYYGPSVVVVPSYPVGPYGYYGGYGYPHRHWRHW